ncbi:hypothetical protein GC722_08325 [Auraticoccus sp. F435]|uniref:Uncharacterized protein n=1 Tax=Auraticoccus cholistanensis TaxID=2656650 RepID=A0A6A9UXK6_9ACTN|nr:DUF6716 putative glycosyltransferase [Auraticoccus cholistanensis]MVA76027.1 hypothetical protein [Auraticoccus cholistanensis]
MAPPTPAPTGAAGLPRRLLVLADSDSYLKWASALVSQLGTGWQVRVLVVRSPITPSPAQVLAATGTALRPVSALAALAAVRRLRPDAVLLACTGPVVRALLEHPPLRARDRPVLVTGLPGISFPARARGLRFREGCDLFVLHSRRECAAHEELAAEIGVPHEFVLATLPFLREGTSAGGGRDVVLAAQAKVPATAEDRRAVLAALAEVPQPWRPVVKVRALPGEQQTHHERWSYAELWPGLARERGWPADRITFRAGSMADALADAHGFVTVSSTAALEALHAGVPTLVLSDFGVSAEMINLVFDGSGLLGTLDDLRADRFPTPDPTWLAENYFHGPDAVSWVTRLEQRVAERRAGRLAPVRLSPAGRFRGPLRRQARVLLPGWLWRGVRRVRRRTPR